jgi:hypothetical protein
MRRHPNRHRARRRTRLFLAALLVAVVAVATQAFSASNSVTVTRRLGEGGATISGFTVTNVHYAANVADPLRVGVVQFDVSPAATRVVMKMVSSSTTAVNCVLTAGNTHATCTWAIGIAPTIQALDQLRVVAVL